jgi:hypothetical protein
LFVFFSLEITFLLVAAGFEGPDASAFSIA